MAKTPDVYIETHPWKIAEKGFHPERSRVSESLFSLGNEYQGVRGYFEEGYSGDTLRGCYLGGLFEEHVLKEPLGYKGISNRIRFMVNTVDWLSIRLEAGGEALDLARCRFSDFRRELDFSSGLLRRELVWHTQSGADIRVELSRLLSMATRELGMQRLSLTSLNGPAEVSVTLGLDFSMPHESYGKCFWECARRAVADKACAMLGVSRNIGQKLFAGFVPPTSEGGMRYLEGDRFIGCRVEMALEKGRTRTVDRACILLADRERNENEKETWERGTTLLAAAARRSFDQVHRDNVRYWRSVWDASDILIEGDPEAQQGIRFCIFQLHQTCRGIMDGSNVDAKGLTGEAYNGHVFWDTETYCLPYYLFNNPVAAKSMLDFRHKTLPQALERARELDCAGACFPVATIDGSESCTLWQHASLQLQPTTAVAYAVVHYASVVGDPSFLHGSGVTLLVQICRFLASRAQVSPRGGYGYYGVMGPDEFHMMVNNNCYTNYMARRTFLSTLEVLDEMERTCPDTRQEILSALGCTERELSAWGDIAAGMIIPYDPVTGLYEQHDGYFDLPHIEVDSIPAAQFPLYAHWSYDRIFRTDMIKQPDVLMLMLLCNGSFSAREKSVNYDYYDPRCIHESSLSPSVHSILASELGRQDEAFELFRFATRIDLDNYNRNTAEGLHMTSIAAAWMNIVYGFGGLRSDGAGISLDPRIPAQWTGYRFPLTWRGSVIRVEVDHARARVSLVSGPPVEIAIRRKACTVTAEGIEVRMPPPRQEREGAAGKMPQPRQEREGAAGMEASCSLPA